MATKAGLPGFCPLLRKLLPVSSDRRGLNLLRGLTEDIIALTWNLFPGSKYLGKDVAVSVIIPAAATSECFYCLVQIPSLPGGWFPMDCLLTNDPTR